MLVTFFGMGQDVANYTCTPCMPRCSPHKRVCQQEYRGVWPGNSDIESPDSFASATEVAIPVLAGSCGMYHITPVHDYHHVALVDTRLYIYLFDNLPQQIAQSIDMLKLYCQLVVTVSLQMNVLELPNVSFTGAEPT